jgi:hypothetical protein
VAAAEVVESELYTERSQAMDGQLHGLPVADLRRLGQLQYKARSIGPGAPQLSLDHLRESFVFEERGRHIHAEVADRANRSTQAGESSCGVGENQRRRDVPTRASTVLEE